MEPPVRCAERRKLAMVRIEKDQFVEREVVMPRCFPQGFRAPDVILIAVSESGMLPDAELARERINHPINRTSIGFPVETESRLPSNRRKNHPHCSGEFNKVRSSRLQSRIAEG